MSAAAAPGAPEARLSTGAWWMMAVFGLAGFVSYTDRLILASLVDRLKVDLTLSDSDVSLLQGAAFALVYVAAGLVFGRLADRVQRRAVLIAGALIWCLGTAACGVAGSFGQLFAARMIVGVGEAALAPAAVSMLAATLPPARLATGIGIFVMGTVIGGPGAIAVGGGLLELFDANQGFGSGIASWRLVLIVAGLGGLVLPLLFLTLKEPLRSVHEADMPFAAVLAYFKRSAPVLLPIYLGLALLSVGDFGVLSWSPSMLSRRDGMSPGDVAAVFGLGTTLFAILGAAGGGVLLDRLSGARGLVARLFWIAAIAVAAATFAACFAIASAATGIAGVLGWTLASSIVAIGGITALQQHVPPSCRGVAMSLVSFFAILIGLGAGPSLIALATDRLFARPEAVGWSIALVCAPAALIGAGLFLVAARKVPRA
jgi:MFS family permease